jgi:hypothetical protein
MSELNNTINKIIGGYGWYGKKKSGTWRKKTRRTISLLGKGKRSGGRKKKMTRRK